MKNKKRFILLCSIIAFTVIAALTVSILAFNTYKKKKTTNKYSDSKITSDVQNFEVIAFSPIGELSASVKYPTIQIQFSRPVVPLQKLGEPSNQCEYVTITPELKGVFRWYGTSLLSFESSQEVIPQKLYTVKVNPKTKSVNGETITGQLEYYLQPEQLSLVSVVPGYGEIQNGNYVDTSSVPPEVARDILVSFNFPVNVDVVKKTLVVSSCSDDENSDESSVNIDFDAKQETKNSIRLTLKNKPEENKLITITLEQGSMADEDCKKTNELQELSFHTLVPFDLKSMDEEPRYVSSQYSNPVLFIFNTAFAQNSEAELASQISSNLSTKITASNIHIDGTQLIVHSLPVNYGSEYELTLGENLKDAYGRKFGKTIQYNIKVPEASSFAYFKNHGFNILESQFDPKLVFQHQNIKENSYYRVSSVADVKGKETKIPALTEILNPENITQNVKVLQPVDLKPFLEKKGDEYRGSVQFNANIAYQYKYWDWNTDSTKTSLGQNINQQTIQVTDLGMTVRYGYNCAAVLVTSLKTGNAVANADVTFYAIDNKVVYSDKTQDLILTEKHPSLGSAKTDANGFAVVEFKNNEISNTANKCIFVEAKTKDDRVMFQPNTVDLWYNGVYNTASPKAAQDSKMVTFIFTDRGLYKPGETITFRGIDRTLQGGEYSSYNGKFYLTLNDGAWRPSVFYEAEGETSANGTFWGTIKLPEDFTPGSYTITYTRMKNSDVKQSIGVQVQYFEKLRFEVNTSIPNITYYSGDDISANVAANYLGGGSLAGSSYNAYWSREQSGFVPADSKYADYSFNPIQGYDGRTSLDNTSGVLNSDGKVNINQKTGGEKLLGVAYRYRLQTSVLDSGRQQISSVGSVLVHPARYYIGLKQKNKNGFPKKGEAVKFDYVCITPDGKAPNANDLPSAKEIKLELLREEWKEVQQVSWNGQINTRYKKEMVTEEEKTIPLSGKNTATEISVTPPKGGAYLLRLSSNDNKGRDVVTERRFYATSSDWYWFNRDNATEITMTLDKESYEVGETAQILMQSPLPKGTYLLTVEREGIVSKEIRKFDSPTEVISLPIEDKYVPVMYVTLSSYSVRSGAPKNDFDTPDLDKPKGYFGVASLNVSTKTRRFDIEIKTDKESYRPGEKAKISIHASSKGTAVSGAEITLMAVDRGVIDLINYHVADPVEYFYRSYLFPNCVAGGDNRSLLMDPVTYEIKNLIGGDSENSENKMQERKNFEPTALFIPSLVTDANGNAEYTFTLPDSLTAYRLTAVGVNQNNFALSEQEVSVANPVSVRSVLPRQLRLNDTGELGVTVSNIDSKAYDVTVELNVYPGIEKTGVVQQEDEPIKLPGNAKISNSKSKKVSVSANKTEAIMFEIEAQEAGWITVEYIVKSAVVNEKILLPLKIEKPYIYETVTTVGDVRSEQENGSATVTEKIILPGDGNNEEKELYVQLDATRLGVLREAISYVFHYPYGCLEQRSSAILPLVAFGDYIKIFGLNSEVKNPKAVAKKEINSWGKHQFNSGAFPYWPGSLSESADVSAQIAEVIAIAKDSGIEIKDINIDALADYLIREANKLTLDNSNGRYNDYTVAHYLYSASCLGKEVSLKTLDEIVQKENSDFETLALCALTYWNLKDNEKAKDIAKKLRNYVTLTTRGISIATSNSKNNYSFFNNNVEKFALYLQLCTSLDPREKINANLVYQLLELQKASNGYWYSTCGTSRALIAFDAYIKSNKLEDLNFTAQALLNGKELVKGSFKGVGAEPVDANLNFDQVPIKDMPRDKELKLEFTKEGKGALFYTASMKYPIPAELQYPRDEGICIFTEIVDIETGEIVTANKLVAGKVYKEKVFVSSTKSYTFMAVRAPIPAGCEIMNAAFVTTGSFPQEENDSDDSENLWENYNYGLSNQEIYDSEVQYFWNYFPAGFQKVEFLFIASRKGTYNTPSATAECMYQSEVFGRSSGKVWTIE